MRIQRLGTWKSAGGAAMLAILSGAGLTGCDEPQAKTEPVVRAIQHMKVEDRASGQVRKISGLIQAADKSTLSFAVGGTVERIFVKLGDQVQPGQTLARLDTKPYRLTVTAAQGKLAEARAQLRDRHEKYKSQRRLYKDGWTTKSKFDLARANYETARGAISIATAELDIARRDLGKTVLKAPFAGSISRKAIDNFKEIQPGQTIFELQNDARLEAAILVPAVLIDLIREGTKVTIKVPNIENRQYQGVVHKVGTKAERANAFPVKILIGEHGAELRPGMTAETTFKFERNGGQKGLLVPLPALLLSDDKDGGFIFVFDPKTQAVARRAVRVSDVSGNDVEVVSGLNPGDIIATAGVSFLNDGQKVTLYRGN